MKNKNDVVLPARALAAYEAYAKFGNSKRVDSIEILHMGI